VSRRLRELALKREQLQQQIARQRFILGKDIEPLAKPLAIADQALDILHRASAHTDLVIGGLIILSTWRNRGAGKWLRRGWLTWEISQNLLKRLIINKQA